MGQTTEKRVCRSLAVYLFVAALVAGTTIQAAAVEAAPPEKRFQAQHASNPMVGRHDDSFRFWSGNDGESDAKPSSFQSWLTGIYNELFAFKSAIGWALSQVWKIGHPKPPKTCS
jgi:hypothetical protein